MPDKGAVRRIGTSFAQKARENLQRGKSGKYVEQLRVMLLVNKNIQGERMHASTS